MHSIVISNTLSLSLIKESDAEQFHQIILASKPHLAKYLYWAENITDLASTEEYLQQRVHSQLPRAAWYKILIDSELCGLFAIKSIQDNIAEVGYWLKQDAQGKGVISQILTAMKKHLKNEGVHSIEIRCLEQNKASINVAKKAGAQLMNTIKNHSVIDGQQQDLLVFNVEI